MIISEKCTPLLFLNKSFHDIIAYTSEKYVINIFLICSSVDIKVTQLLET